MPAIIEDPLILSVGLVLLLLPRRLLRWRKSHRSSEETQHEIRQRTIRAKATAFAGGEDTTITLALRHPTNWIDLFRGGLGTYAVVHFGLSFDWVEASPWQGVIVPALLLALLLPATALQMLRRPGSHRLPAPLFFVIGASLGLVEHLPTLGWMALLTLASLMCMQIVLRGPTAALTLFGLLYFGFGLLLFQLDYNLAVVQALILCLMPVLAHWLLRRDLHLEWRPPGHVR